MKKTYAYHKPSDRRHGDVVTLRKAFSALHELIEATCPESRERSVALTHLETPAMWAIKSVVCNDPEATIVE